MHDPKKNSAAGADAKYELRDVEIRPIVIFLLALGLMIVVSFGSMAWFFSYLDSQEASRDVPPSPLAGDQRPPEPRLQSTSRGELDEVLGQDEKRLNQYEWIDREAGVVRIPIDRAMELIAERGLPARSVEETAAGRGERAVR